MGAKAPSFFIISSSNLQVIRTAIECRMSSNSGHIRLLASELPALERRKKCHGHDSTFSFDLIGSSSNLQITRTDIKSRTSSLSSQIGLFALELLALERRNFSP